MEAYMEKKNAEIQAINRQTFSQRLKSYKRSPLSLILLILVSMSALITVMTLLFLLAYILIKGVPYLTPDLFAWEYNSENVSLMPALINTIIMTGLSLIIAAPLGIFSAIYLVEYAKRGNKLVALIRITAETLSGIPSIVYGLFGFLLFAVTFQWSYTILGGALTLAIMILPLIMRQTEEALKIGSGFLSGSKLWTGSRTVKNSFLHCASVSSSGYSGRNYSGSWTNSRGDSSFDVYGRHRGRNSGKPFRFRADSGCSYVCADQ